MLAAFHDRITSTAAYLFVLVACYGGTAAAQTFPPTVPTASAGNLQVQS
jgi:hypothetical protein